MKATAAGEARHLAALVSTVGAGNLAATGPPCLSLAAGRPEGISIGSENEATKKSLDGYRRGEKYVL